jgi:hypothetical protein
MTDLAEAPTTPKRPMLVWVVSIYYFLSGTIGSISLALIPFMSSGRLPVTEAQQHYFESMGYLDYSASIIMLLGQLIGGVLLFMLKRSAFYVLMSIFALSLLRWGYALIVKNWISAAGGIPVATTVGWALMIAMILYVRHLFQKGVLR